jgi:hypothetical protein
MDLVQKILESIHNRIYIWQYAEYTYPVVKEYMFDTPGKDISKVTDRYVWVLGQHIFFTPVSHFHENEKHTHLHENEKHTHLHENLGKGMETWDKERVCVRDRTSDWKEFRGLQELADLTARKPTDMITWDDIHRICVKSKNAN